MRTALLLAACAAACGPAAREPARAPETVLLVVLDALHAGHVGHLGYARDTTPVLDALAAEGVTFTRALAPAPYTLASVASLITGRLPDHHGLVQKGRRLPDAESTLAERLAEAGYRTFGATATSNSSALLGVDQGFERFVEVFRGAGPPGARSFEADGETRHVPRADELVPVLEDFLARTGPDESALVSLHVLEPHSPYWPPPEFRQRFVRDPAYDGPLRDGDPPALVATLGREVDEADVRHATDLYDANLAWADAVLGRLLDALRAAGRYDGAWVVVTSDHGEAFWQHGRWGHNDLLYDEMVHVPLVVKPPRDRPLFRGRCDALVSLLDVAPGLLDWLGLDAGAPVDGVPLGSTLAGTAPPARRLLLRAHQRRPVLALRSATEKLIVTPGAEPRWELYDLVRDPGEHQDRGVPQDGELAERARALQQLATRLGRSPARAETAPEGAAEGAADRALLRALGYAE